MKKTSFTDMLIFIVGTEAVGAVSALLAGSFSDFFAKYQRPPLMPPMWVFPVVWTVLYAVMGYSAYLVYSDIYTKEAEKKSALRLYFIQLAINFSWSIIFFRFEFIIGAAAVIIALIVLTAMMIISFWRVRPLAGKLNIPYFIWLLFAAYLNIATAVVN